jgi:hypothetical protein
MRFVVTTKSRVGIGTDRPDPKSEGTILYRYDAQEQYGKYASRNESTEEMQGGISACGMATAMTRKGAINFLSMRTVTSVLKRPPAAIARLR